MDLVSRVQGILLKPEEEWTRIKPEPTPILRLYTSYVLILAAIPALSQFLTLVIIGRRLPFVGWLRVGIGFALGKAIWAYFADLVLIFIGAIIINALAPIFSSKQDLSSAFKLLIYSATPGWIAGVFFLVPFLGIFATLVAFYGVYLLYLGIKTPMLDTPKSKSIPFVAILAAIWIVLKITSELIMTAIFAVGGVYRPL